MRVDGIRRLWRATLHYQICDREVSLTKYRIKPSFLLSVHLLLHNLARTRDEEELSARGNPLQLWLISTPEESIDCEAFCIRSHHHLLAPPDSSGSATPRMNEFSRRKTSTAPSPGAKSYVYIILSLFFFLSEKKLRGILARTH